MAEEHLLSMASQRPHLAEVVSGACVPVVDLACPDRAAVVAAIGGACCRTHGFFQLPAEEKAKLYSDDPARKIRLSTSFNVRKETVHNLRDYLRLHCHPIDQETMSIYGKEVRELGLRLYAAIPESLGLEPGYIIFPKIG
ncbi:hypothetical protein SETIT_6G041500v2 [Setaria italica]|uniref:Non-haem dioxygenase N-terminal domain-containing protein n=1 Tax=Setaria italica TaxID=4555 RepID=A0A368RI22_SETIT|nr:hypothetical protein SETIT_6G041500v2 [Setaria italica]